MTRSADNHFVLSLRVLKRCVRWLSNSSGCYWPIAGASRDPCNGKACLKTTRIQVVEDEALLSELLRHTLSAEPGRGGGGGSGPGRRDGGAAF